MRGGVYLLHAYPWSYDHRPSHPHNAGTEHVELSPTGRHRVHRKREGGGTGVGVLISCIAVVLRPLTLASLHCQDGERRVFTDQADIACTKREVL